MKLMVKRQVSCGEYECEGDCEKEPEWLLCKGNQSACKANCPKRVRETEIIRAGSKARHKHREVG